MGRQPLHPYLPLVDPLMNSLMGVEKTRLQGEMAKLVARNHRAGGGEAGFYYLDMRFSDRDRRFQNGEGLPTVHRSLTQEAQDLYDQFKKVERDEQRLRQALSVVVPKCRELQDIRDVLPEVFIREVPQLRGMERIREPGFILDEYPVLRKQYDSAVEIAHYYTVNKLLM